MTVGRTLGVGDARSFTLFRARDDENDVSAGGQKLRLPTTTGRHPDASAVSAE